MAKKKVNKETEHCAFCSKPVDKLSSVSEGEKLFHDNDECYPAYLKSGNTSKDRRVLTDFIDENYISQKNLSKEDRNIFWKQLGCIMENVRKKHDLTYLGMLATLKYLLNELNYEFTDGLIGLIPYHYYDTRKLNKEIVKAQKEGNQIDFAEYYNLKRTVYAERKELEPAIDIKPIDINSIESDGEIDDIW